MDNKPFFLALNRMPQVGPRITMKLQAFWPNLADLFAMTSCALQKAGLSEKLAKTISTFDMKTCDADLHWEQEAENHHILTWEDPAYPTLLRETYDPPIVLYTKGDLRACDQNMLAMVGTRKPSSSGGETARHFAYQLAKYPITIVSGLAQGIDKEAHEGCLGAKGRTIAVMGTGIDRIYPSWHQRLAEQIPENGLLITEFPLKSRPSAGHFPRRNRIISGLSSATLVVEAAIKSGSLITARLALEQNRDVLAIPGSIHNHQARGCHYLLQQGATLVASVQDVLDAMGIRSSLRGEAEAIQRPDEVSQGHWVASASPRNDDLVNCIDFTVTTIDKIIERSGFNLEQVVAELAQLEIAGIVKAVPGGYARRILPGIHPSEEFI